MMFKKNNIQTNESITIKYLDARLNSGNMKLNHRCVQFKKECYFLEGKPKFEKFIFFVDLRFNCR